MQPNWDHNEGRPPSMQDVEAIMTKLRPAKKSNPQILGINQIQIQKAQQQGYPKHMYHSTLDPVIALNEDQAAELQMIGYTETYEFRQFPMCIFRRNFAPRFGLKLDPGTKEPLNHEFVEERIVKTKAQYDDAHKEPLRNGKGKWYDKISELLEAEPLPSETPEEQANYTARLEGELTALRAQVGRPETVKGRKSKEQELATA
jgi:hypothetical protein